VYALANKIMKISRFSAQYYENNLLMFLLKIKVHWWKLKKFKRRLIFNNFLSPKWLSSCHAGSMHYIYVWMCREKYDMAFRRFRELRRDLKNAF
jgi:hypothetical protein